MVKGFIGEFFVYRLSEEKLLLVDPDPDIESNFDLYKAQNKHISSENFRGLRSIVLEEGEELIPVKVEGSEDYFEGIYIKQKKS